MSVRPVRSTGRTPAALLGLADDDDVLKIFQPAAHLGDFIPERTMGNQDLGPAVVEKISVILGAHQGVDGHRHGADLHRPEEAGGEFGRIVEQEQDAVLHLDA
jgi:hypothetical protein